jgi:DNA polymerase
MNLLVLDFESFFDSEYSLSKMTTESYVRDKRFGTHMCGFWFPDRMPAPATCTDASLRNNEQFRQQIEESAVLCHHAAFDGLILNHHYDLRPKMWLDTLSMSRLVWPKLKSHSLDALALHCGLPSKHVPYNLFKGVQDLQPELYRQVADGCQHDCWLTYEILKRLLPSVPKEELIVIDSTVRMFTQPVLELDRPRMQAFLQAERIRKAKAMLAAGAALGIPVHLATTADEMRDLLARIETELQSSDKFRIALESIGHVCPMKWSAKQEKEIPALAKNDSGMDMLLEHDDVRVQALAAARLGVKSTIDETRAERLLDMDTRGALPMYLTMYATKTLRVGGGDKNNVLNWRRGGEIRKSIKAPPAHKIVVGDESQIEYRLLLWVTGQWDKLEALAAGRDLYCEFASQFYGETITKDMKEKRGVGKQGILMGGYGAGAATQIRTAAGGGYGPPVYLSQIEGERMVGIYRNGHTCVTAFWRWCDRVLPLLGNGGQAEYKGGVIQIRDHRIWFPNGTAMDYTGMRWATNDQIFEDQANDGSSACWWEPTRKGWSRMWGSKLTADIIQGLARVLITGALTRFVQRHRLALQVYDELVAIVPDDQAEEALAFMLDVLRTPPSWAPDIPLDAEGLIAQNYDK